MLLKRVLSGIILALLILVVIWFTPYWLFTFIFSIVILLGLFEFYSMAGLSFRDLLLYSGVLWTILFIVDSYYGQNYAAPILASFIVISLILLILRFNQRTSFNRWVWVVAGILYAGWLSSHVILLRNVGGLTTGRNWVIITLFATAASDSMAYLVGRTIGRHSMAPAISPRKTWEGAIGGLIGGLGATIALAAILGISIDWKIVVLGLIIPVAGMLGDLIESMLKRSFGVKDSGNIIPGHGGVLDRIDSIIFVVVVVYYYLIWVI
ncbi:MAG: phosphatidate cytidylyltransferase [Chloroflexi bacterium]|nr:phosphatidate cytidylyltransferase [Chloroflexota bacterium]